MYICVHVLVVYAFRVIIEFCVKRLRLWLEPPDVLVLVCLIWYYHLLRQMIQNIGTLVRVRSNFCSSIAVNYEPMHLRQCITVFDVSRIWRKQVR